MRFTDPHCQDALARLSTNDDYGLVMKALQEWQEEQTRQLIYAHETERALVMIGMVRAIDMTRAQLTFKPR